MLEVGVIPYWLLPEGDHSVADGPADHKGGAGVESDLGHVGDTGREPHV